jgi:hypothetical protein
MRTVSIETVRIFIIHWPGSKIRQRHPFFTYRHDLTDMRSKGDVPGHRCLSKSIMMEIVNQAASFTLPSLALVCRQLRLPCQKVLFRNITFDILDYRYGFFKFIATVNESRATPGPHHAPLQTFIYNIYFDVSDTPITPSEDFSTFATILPYLVNLRSLTISIHRFESQCILWDFARCLGMQFPEGFKTLKIHTHDVSE